VVKCDADVLEVVRAGLDVLRRLLLVGLGSSHGQFIRILFLGRRRRPDRRREGAGQGREEQSICEIEGVSAHWKLWETPAAEKLASPWVVKHPHISLTENAVIC